MPSADALKALASGGTAGLDAYKSAQADAIKNQGQAVDNTFKPGGSAASPYGGYDFASVLGGSSRGALDSYIKGATQSSVTAAGQAVGSAQSQIGYDHSAMDSYLAKQQAQFDEANREAAAKRSLDQQQFDFTLDQKKKSMGIGLTPEQQFAALPMDQQKAYIAGGGQLLQQKDLQNQQTQAVQSQHQGRNEAQRRDVQTFRAEQGQQQLDDAAAQQLPGGEQDNAARDAIRARIAWSQANAADAQTGKNWLDSYVAQAPANMRQSAIDLPSYEREAASKFGWDPALAQGYFGSTPGELNKQQTALDDYMNYDTDQARKEASARRTDASGAVTDQYNDISAATGMDPSDIKRLAGGALSTEDVGKILSSDEWGAASKVASDLTASGEDDAWKQFVKQIRDSPFEEATKQASIRYYRTVFADNGYSTSVS